nr:EOG090X06H8 [Eurycercus lamellatus]
MVLMASSQQTLTPPIGFRVDQLEPLEQWFESCNGAQQATIAVKLLSRANPKAAHLIHAFLQQRLLVASAIWRHEIQQANDPAFLNGLRNESRDVAVSQLLHYLPLLRPANADGVRGYVHLLPSLLASFLEDDPSSQQQQTTTEIQQLLTYALIHPALSLENKRSLAELIRQLDDDGTQEMALSLLDSNQQGGLDMFPSCSSSSSPVATPGLGPSPAAGQRIRRSNSLTPPSYGDSSWNTASTSAAIKPRSLSLSSTANNDGLPHCPLSPQNSLASSGSGSGSDSIYSDDNHRSASFQVPGSGMKDVPSWLKGLRLHKYAHLFSLMTYDEMLALTEEQLELQGVTKGARHKIALSIQRLRDRPTLLAQLEKEVVDTGNLHNALMELKNVLSTPIKPYRGGVGSGGGGSGSGSSGHPVDCCDQLYVNGSLSPSPSPLTTRDDTSGYSSPDAGSMDNLAPARSSSDDKLLPAPPPLPPPSSSSVRAQSSSVSSSGDVMPTVIVSAAPDMDSAGEEGSDTSVDDGLGGCCLGSDSLSPTFRSSSTPFGSSTELELIVPSHLCPDDLPICTQLLVSAIPAEESVSQFVALLDRCLGHEAFTQRQRRRIASWKEQAHRIWTTTATLASGGGRIVGPSVPPASSSTGSGQHAGNNKSNASDSRCFARRWSNVAHYPGFYNSSSATDPSGPAAFQPNAYSLFPPHRQQQQQRGPSPSSRPSFAGPTHNSYGQHTHAPGQRLTPTPSGLNGPAQHSLQVGSHLPLQHRNSFCVSTLSQHQSSLGGGGNTVCYNGPYSSLDPFNTFPATRSNPFEDHPPSADTFRFQQQRARSSVDSSTANGISPNLLMNQERDAFEMDLNHRLESLCLSMTEHALEGANDI